MKPAPFAYHSPAELGEALRLLSSLGEGARPLAGGQSLVPLLNLRLARPAAIVDLNGIGSLAYHRLEAEALLVGALCRHRDIELDAEASRRCDAIADAAPLIGHVGIRNRGTVAGSIAHADPSAEWPALAVLLEAELRVTGESGERTIAARDFFKGPFSTALAPGEILTEVRFPWPPPDAGSAFVEVARRHGDFALGAAAAVVELGADGRLARARLAFAGFDAVPVRAMEAEAALAGRPARGEAFKEAADLAASTVRPSDDIHAPAAYRRELARTLARRALSTAAERAMRGRSNGRD
jgi:carbon-monoxide dehydrogenase medium subunit